MTLNRDPRPVWQDRPPLPPEFAETGVFLRRRDGAPPTRFHVLGERSSGTNLLKTLLKRNTAMHPTEALGWKHGFPPPGPVPADLAVICVVRNPADWALSMHRRPWHTVPAMQKLGFSDFIRAPWQTHLDRRAYFKWLDAPFVPGAPLMQDRDPATGAPFANLLALRRAKLAGLLGLLDRDCTLVVLRLETLQAGPEAAIRQIAALGPPAPPAPFRPVTRRLGIAFVPAVSPRPGTPGRLCAEDRAFMASQLDLGQEATLGYHA